jgi:Ku protein
VTIPVRLYRAARKETVRLRYLHKESESQQSAEERQASDTLTRSQRHAALQLVPPAAEPESAVTVSPIRQQLVSDADEPVARTDVVHGYEYAPDQYAVIGRDEIQTLRVSTSKDLTIIQTAQLTEIDPVYFETSYYVVPDRGGERPYTLFYSALQKSGYVAIARVAMHGRQHVVIVRAGRRGLLAHTMYYGDEVRAENEFETRERYKARN